VLHSIRPGPSARAPTGTHISAFTPLTLFSLSSSKGGSERATCCSQASANGEGGGDACGPGAGRGGGGGERGRGGGAAVQRGAAGSVRPGDHQRVAAHGVVLLQPARAGAVLLPVRAQPGVQQLHQQPQRPPHARLLRHRRPELLGASSCLVVWVNI
jgi:hypothetical protein